MQVKQNHLQPLLYAGPELMCCLKLPPLLTHDERSQAFQLQHGNAACQRWNMLALPDRTASFCATEHEAAAQLVKWSLHTAGHLLPLFTVIIIVDLGLNTHLIKVRFLQNLLPCLFIHRQHADTIPQEVEYQAKVLWITIYEDSALPPDIQAFRTFSIFTGLPTCFAQNYKVRDTG